MMITNKIKQSDNPNVLIINLLTDFSILVDIIVYEVNKKKNVAITHRPLI